MGMDQSQLTNTSQSGDELHWLKSLLGPVAMVVALSIIRWQCGVLLFHTLAELFSIIVGVLMLVIVWNTRRFTSNDFLLYLGIGFFAIAVLDSCHTFTVKGMPFFDIDDAEITLHFWIYTRFAQAILMLTAPFFLTRKLNVPLMLVVTGIIFTIICWMSIGFDKPAMLTAQGLTNFKVYSEYVILIVFCCSVAHFIRVRRLLTQKIFYYSIVALVLTILSELSFTLYTDFGGIPFVVGHLLKIVAFWCVYQAIVFTTLRDPFSVLARGSNSYDAIPHPSIVVNKDGVVSQVNRAAEELSGKSEEYLLHKSVHEHFHPNGTSPAECELCAAINEGKELNKVVVFYPERDSWMLVSLSPVEIEHSVHGMVLSLTDITDQVIASKQLQQEIREREFIEQENLSKAHRIHEQQEAIIRIAELEPKGVDLSELWPLVTDEIARGCDVELVSLWMFAKDRDTLVCEDLFCTSTSEHVKEHALDLSLYPKYKQALESNKHIKADDALVDERTKEFADEYFKPLGITSMLDAPIRMKGTVAGVICFEHVGEKRLWTVDECIFAERIADQVASLLSEKEIELNSSRVMELQNYLARVIDSMPSVLIGVDHNCLVTQWNTEASRIWGTSAEDAMGHEIGEMVPCLKGCLEAIREAIKTREVLVLVKQKRLEEGHTYYDDITVYPLGDDIDSGAVIRVDDVTERVQLDNVVIQTEKMMSVGGLAAGMAHEINNPLAVITQGIQNIIRRLNPEIEKNVSKAAEFDLDLNKMHEFLEERKVIQFLGAGKDAVDRAAGIVKNMLMFSRKSDSSLNSVNLETLMDHTIQLGSTDYDMKKKYDFKFVDIVKEYDDDLPEVICCANEIEQVLLNLFKNALQAMETIEDKSFKPLMHARINKEVDYVRIEVEDNGAGIPSDIKRRIFEPFFTTKPAGIGTGLGLSVSYMIITQNHGGTFEVESEEGKGTKFIIRLPLTRTDDPVLGTHRM